MGFEEFRDVLKDLTAEKEIRELLTQQVQHAQQINGIEELFYNVGELEVMKVVGKEVLEFCNDMITTVEVIELENRIKAISKDIAETKAWIITYAKEGLTNDVERLARQLNELENEKKQLQEKLKQARQKAKKEKKPFAESAKDIRTELKQINEKKKKEFEDNAGTVNSMAIEKFIEVFTPHYYEHLAKIKKQQRKAEKEKKEEKKEKKKQAKKSKK